MPELKPCPFCGGQAFSYHIPPHKHFLVDFPDHTGSGYVECGLCTAVLSAETEEAAIEAWNRRIDNAKVD